MDSNHDDENNTSALTNVNNSTTTWNMHKMMMMMETTTATAAAAEGGQHDDDHHIILQVQADHQHHQIPMASSGIGIGIHHHHHNQLLQMQVPISTCSSIMAPSSSSSSSSGFLGDILGMHMVQEGEAADEEEAEEELGAMKEMMYKIAAMQPVDIDPASIRKPKRRNVRISEDPQSVAARHRRERISERIRILQRLVPGGTKMDTASMLDEAIRYVKFLKRQIRLLQQSQPPPPPPPPPPHCITTTSSTFLLSTPAAIGDYYYYWPFAPSSSMIHTSASAPMDVPAGGHGSSTFNHHEVISDD